MRGTSPVLGPGHGCVSASLPYAWEMGRTEAAAAGNVGRPEIDDR